MATKKMPTPKEIVAEKLKEKKLMMFSKSYCPFCKKAKTVLRKYLDQLKKDEYEIWDMDLGKESDGGAAILEVLGKLTGAKTVPRVFINGKFIGGGDDIEKKDKTGELVKLLQEERK